MHGVFAQALFDFAVLSGQHGTVIYIGDAVTGAESLQTGIEAANLFKHIRHFFTPAKVIGGQHAANHGAYSVGPGQLYHTDNIAVGEVFYVRVSQVVSYVVNAGQDNHHRGVYVNDVLAETEQHLGSLFPADASANEAVLLKEAGAPFCPDIRDGISHEHHTGTAAHFGEGGVSGGITVQVSKTLGRCHRSQQEHQGQNKYEFFHGWLWSKNVDQR